jgi:hypothetical protein
MFDVSAVQEVLLFDTQWHKVDPNSFAVRDHLVTNEKAPGNKINFETNKWSGDTNSKAAFWKESGKTVVVPMSYIYGFRLLHDAA